MRRIPRTIALSAALLAGTAVTSPALAVTPCLAIGSPMAPPCIVIDTSRIAESINKIKQMRDKIAELSQIAENFADINKIMGAKAEAIGKPIKAWIPIAPGKEISFAQAANEMAAIMPESDSMTADQNDAQRAAMIIAERASSGDGWSVSGAMKERLVGMRNDGDIVAKAAGQCSTTLRRDWQINTHAKLLYLRSLMALRELRQAKALHNAVGTINYEPTEKVDSHDREDAPEYQPQRTHDFVDTLTEIALLTAQLLSVQNGNEAAKAFDATISEINQTKNEYAALEQIAAQANTRVNDLANATAAEKGVTAQELLNAVNAIMTKLDQSTWDTPDKDVITLKAATTAREMLNGMVDGDVSETWIQALIARAEANKQAAFFKEYAGSADQYLKSTIAAQAAYSSGIGTDIQDAQAMQARIAELEKQVADLKASLAGASPEIKQKADALIQQLNVAAGAVPPTAADEIAPDPAPTASANNPTP